MARRRKTESATSQPYPFDVDESLAGTQVRIRGEQGIYSIKCLEFNPRNGSHWYVLYGPITNAQGYRHIHPSDVKSAKRGAKFASP